LFLTGFAGDRVVHGLQEGPALRCRQILLFSGE